PWCMKTQQFFWPPGPVSPFDLATAITWRNARRSGTLVGAITYRRSFLPQLEKLMPYAIGFVALDDGPRLQVHLRNIALASPDRTDERVEIFFEPLLEGYQPVPMAQVRPTGRKT
ncbi:MAG: Zn-ribbon domain-containing OB-fold protein, partial [Tepidisphaerales bacterium]